MSKGTLEERMQRLKHEMERLRAVREIKNLVGNYTVFHSPKTFKRTPELFALKQPDVSAEIAMWGVFIGAQQIKNLYEKLHEEPLVGTMFEHHFTHIIQVAADGKTAKGVFYSPGHETPLMFGELASKWCWGVYGADFIKEDGEWKIWHWHFYGGFMADYYQSWLNARPPDPDFDITKIQPNFAYYHADKPMTRGAGYHKTEARELVPGWPEPYETWDGKSMA